MSENSAKALLVLLDEGVALYEADEAVNVTADVRTPPPQEIAVGPDTADGAAVAPAAPLEGETAAKEPTATPEPQPPLDIDSLLRKARATHRAAEKTLAAHQTVAVMPLNTYLTHQEQRAGLVSPV